MSQGLECGRVWYIVGLEGSLQLDMCIRGNIWQVLEGRNPGELSERQLEYSLQGMGS